MAPYVTYSLKVDGTDSVEYYKTVRALTNEVLQRADERVGAVIDDYLAYIKKYNLEETREREEYLLELLSFGILWRIYSPVALSVKNAPFVTLSKMGEWRKKHQRVKPAIDIVRGVLISLFLLKGDTGDKTIPLPTLEKIDRVCLWLESTGEFREEALRYVRWRAFWGMLDPEKQFKIFSAIADFRSWFETRAREVLGIYTLNVGGFISANRKKYLWREDRISCMRTEVEYHLNMVGAELMNRAFKKEFDGTKSTSVLLPGCMRARTKEDCEALREDKGLKCIGCEPKCRVNHLRLIGEKKNFDVYVIPHASDLSLWASKNESDKRGIVASACVTTLVEGGWELKRYGIPAQCVLLNFSGCKKHWHPDGVMTELNKSELERIISRSAN